MLVPNSLPSTSDRPTIDEMVATAQSCHSEKLTGAQSTSLPSISTRVVFLTHYIPLYQVRVFQEITKSIPDFKILLSTPIEPNRDFRPDWSGLDVEVQKTFMLRRRWKHRSAGFSDPLYIHVPYDTTSRLKSISPDVVVSHELGARSIAASRYCRQSGAKLVLATFMSEHTEQDRGWLRSRVRKRLIRSADAITYNGPSCRDYLLSMGAAKEKLFLLPYAADDRNRLAELPTRDEQAIRHRLICVGQLSERKGVLRMINQLSDYCKAENRSIELTLVGDGPLRQQISEAPHDERLTVNLLGNQPARDLPALMQQNGAAIAPTLADEWLLVVDEAMHAGIPVIGSIYAQAVTTLVQEGQNGWSYNPLHSKDDTESRTLSDALNQYFRCDERTIQSMRRSARESVASRTPGRSADGAIAAIKSALNSNESSG